MPVKISGVSAPSPLVAAVKKIGMSHAPANSTPNMETDSLITPGPGLGDANLKSFSSIEALMADLNDEDDSVDLGAVTQTADPRIDRLAELLAWQESVKKDARTKELADLVKALKGEVPADLDPDVDYVFEGESHKYVFGPASNDRYIADMEAVKTAFGDKVFMELVKVNLTDLDKYLTPDQLGTIIGISRGSRKPTMLIKPS